MGGDQCQNGGSNLEGGDFKLRGGILCNGGCTLRREWVYFKLIGGVLQVERGYTLQ